MRHTIYKCDQCKKEIGEKKHLSFQFYKFSGVSVPVKPAPYTLPSVTRWEVRESLDGKFMHFCGVACMSKYFVSSMKKADVEMPF